LDLPSSASVRACSADAVSGFPPQYSNRKRGVCSGTAVALAGVFSLGPRLPGCVFRTGVPPFRAQLLHCVQSLKTRFCRLPDPRGRLEMNGRGAAMTESMNFLAPPRLGLLHARPPLAHLN